MLVVDNDVTETANVTIPSNNTDKLITTTNLFTLEEDQHYTIRVAFSLFNQWRLYVH